MCQCRSLKLHFETYRYSLRPQVTLSLHIAFIRNIVTALIKMSFKTWVVENYLNSDNAYGDFARDMNMDPSFPDSNNLEDCQNYLEHKSALDEAKQAMIELFALWTKG